MDLIEQVAFVGAETECSDGRARAVASPGVCGADLQEILAWGPAQESLLPIRSDAASLHFHPLPSGAFVIGRTMPALRGRGPCGRLNRATQCLVVGARTLMRFANNPFALLRAAQAEGVFRTAEELPGRLDAFRLDGRAAEVDTRLLRRLGVYPGAAWVAALVQAVLDSASTAIVGGPQAEHLVEGLMNCLPPECRTQISFSIGLRFSGRRPYRLVALARDAEEPQRMARLYHVAVLDLSRRSPPAFAPTGSWGSLIQRVLRSGQLSFFASQLARRPLDFCPPDLSALALQLLEEFDATVVEEEPGAPDPCAEAPCHDEDDQPLAPGEVDRLRFPPAQSSAKEPLEAEGASRWASAPLSSASAAGAETSVRASPPSHQIETTPPAVLEKLERLDDLVFDAISGNAASLEEIKSFWPYLRKELGDSLLAESREQYLRYALASWEEVAHRDGVRDASVAVRSLEVLCVLFGGA